MNTLTIAEMKRLAKASYISKIGDKPIEAIETCGNRGVTHSSEEFSSEPLRSIPYKKERKSKHQKGGKYDENYH